MTDREKPTTGNSDPLTYEVTVATGKSVITARITEREAEMVAKSFGIDWPTACAIRWPLTLKRIGVRPDIEAEALARALRPVVEIPDGEIVVWVAGKRDVEIGEGEGDFKVVTGEEALALVKAEIAAAGDGWGWVVRTGRTGDALAGE